MLRQLVTAAASLLLMSAVTSSAQARQPLVELQTDEERYEGRVVDKGRGWCVLFDRYGRMHTVDTKDVRKFRTLSPSFTPHSFSRIRTRLLNEFGKEYEVGTSRHYVVCAPAGRAQAYADVFESTWRRLHMYFSVRGFEIPDPEFPLVAVVFKDQRSFLEHARREKASVAPGVLGYYWSTHNWVIMFEDTRRQAGRAAGKHITVASHFRRDADPWNFAFHNPSFDQLAARAGINGDLRETMIHEATHQLGYNLGLHNRVGRNPRWIVEGLATVFETPGMENQRRGTAIKRANAGWLRGFQRFVSTGRPENYLEEFIRTDRAFQSSMSSAYAQAWALSFWLIETRPREYGRFLRRMAADDVAKSLTDDLRVEIFRETFGSNLVMLDREMLRFYDGLK